MPRNDLKILGRTIGTFDGWDGDPDCMIFCEFKPHDVLKDDLPEGDLTFNMEAGDFTYCDDDGNETKRVDVIKIMNMIQRDPDVPTV